MTLHQDAKLQLETWHRQKPVIALMGEFSAGKSTLLNLMLDGDHLPTKVTATNLPAVWITKSDSPFFKGLRHDGTLEDIDPEALGEDVRETYLLLQFGVNAPVLDRTDLIDTPGISDPKLAKGATLFLGPYLDGVLWLSPANQAWRQTEKVVWSGFPDTLRAHSMIVLTRADKLRRKSDLTKVKKRVQRDTETLFCDLLALNTPLAAASKDEPASGDWATSGGKQFAASFDAILTRAEAMQTERGGPVPVAAEPVSEPATPAGAAHAESEPSTPSDAASAFSAVSLFESARSAAGEMNKLSQIKSFFGQISVQLEEHPALNPVHRFVLKQSLCLGETDDVNVERLIEQASAEFADFDQDAWCVVSTG